MPSLPDLNFLYKTFFLIPSFHNENAFSKIIHGGRHELDGSG